MIQNSTHNEINTGMQKCTMLFNLLHFCNGIFLTTRTDTSTRTHTHTNRKHNYAHTHMHTHNTHAHAHILVFGINLKNTHKYRRTRTRMSDIVRGIVDFAHSLDREINHRLMNSFLSGHSNALHIHCQGSLVLLHTHTHTQLH